MMQFSMRGAESAAPSSECASPTGESAADRQLRACVKKLEEEKENRDAEFAKWLGRAQQAVESSVERFDIEPFSDFSAK